MKANKMWFVIMAAMIMSSVMFLTSCSKDDELDLPEVIESEVLDEGLDNTVVATPNVAPDGTSLGTKLSYQSWIMVKGHTRAAFENKVQVTLNNAFNNTDTTIVVPDFNLGDYTTEISYKKRSERREGFVTVSDSLLVYTVKFNNFSFDYELDHEVAVYNDGMTEQEMPYHQIGFIEDNGYKLTYLDSSVAGEEAYSRRQLTHFISVTFNGKKYDLSARVMLYRHLGSAYEPYVLRSQLIAEGAWTSGEHLITSVLNIHQVWSDGRTNDDPVVCYFPFDNDGKLYEPAVITIRNYKSDLRIVKTEIVKGDLEPTYREGNYVQVYDRIYLVNVDYGYFQMSIPIVSNEAYYDDGVLSRAFPCFEPSNITVLEPEFVFENTGSDENGSYSVYWLTQKVKANLDQASAEILRNVQIVIYE